MKKLIAILMVFVLVLSVAACGKKQQPAETTAPQSGENAGTQQGETNKPAGEKTEPSTPGADTPDTTTPVDDPNRIDPVETPPTQSGGNNANKEDDDIKVEINNGGTSNKDDEINTAPPSDNNNGSFVIDFDQLLEAGNKK